MARLDKLNLVRLSQIKALTAREIYLETADLLNQRLKDTSPKIKELKDASLQEGFIKRTISAIAAEQIIGGLVFGYEPDEDSIILKYLGVSPNHIGFGIGSKLVEEVERLTREMELRKISLQTFEPHSGEIDLPEWYKRRGYQKVDSPQNPFSPRRYVLMEKRL